MNESEEAKLTLVKVGGVYDDERPKSIKTKERIQKNSFAEYELGARRSQKTVSPSFCWGGIIQVSRYDEFVIAVFSLIKKSMRTNFRPHGTQPISSSIKIGHAISKSICCCIRRYNSIC